MDDRWYKSTSTVLLTGAGFTKTFGGYLAREMWSAIFNQPQLGDYPNLKKCARWELDFETLYDKVMNSSDYTPQEKNCLTECIGRSYALMHENITKQPPEYLATSANVCHPFISYFAGLKSKNEGTFLFTLNQDLFIERFYSNSDTNKSVGIPGLEGKGPNWFNGNLKTKLEPEDFVRLPDRAGVEKLESEFWSKRGYHPITYIKLHGSFGWKFHDGRPGLVIGHAKTETLKKEPLLWWQMKLFREVLRDEARQLVVIGYGFNDQHINDVIADAIRDKKLKLHMISPKSPDDFEQELFPVHGDQMPKPRGQEFWDALAGYHEGEIHEFYESETQALSPKGKALMTALGLM